MPYYTLVINKEKDTFSVNLSPFVAASVIARRPNIRMSNPPSATAPDQHQVPSTLSVPSMSDAAKHCFNVLRVSADPLLNYAKRATPYMARYQHKFMNCLQFVTGETHASTSPVTCFAIQTKAYVYADPILLLLLFLLLVVVRACVLQTGVLTYILLTVAAYVLVCARCVHASRIRTRIFDAVCQASERQAARYLCSITERTMGPDPISRVGPNISNNGLSRSRPLQMVPMTDATTTSIVTAAVSMESLDAFVIPSSAALPKALNTPDPLPRESNEVELASKTAAQDKMQEEHVANAPPPDDVSRGVLVGMNWCGNTYKHVHIISVNVVLPPILCGLLSELLYTLNMRVLASMVGIAAIFLLWHFAMSVLLIDEVSVVHMDRAAVPLTYGSVTTGSEAQNSEAEWVSQWVVKFITMSYLVFPCLFLLVWMLASSTSLFSVFCCVVPWFMSYRVLAKYIRTINTAPDSAFIKRMDGLYIHLNHKLMYVIGNTLACIALLMSLLYRTGGIWHQPVGELMFSLVSFGAWCVIAYTAVGCDYYFAAGPFERLVYLHFRHTFYKIAFFLLYSPCETVPNEPVGALSSSGV